MAGGEICVGGGVVIEHLFHLLLVIKGCKVCELEDLRAVEVNLYLLIYPVPSSVR